MTNTEYQPLMPPGNRRGPWLTAATSAAAAVGQAIVGTGAVDGRAFLQAGTTGAPVSWLGKGSLFAGEAKAITAPSMQTRLSVLRQTLGLSMSELGRILGVTRQAVYNWQRGGAIDAANDQRLQSVVAALEPHVELFRTRPGGVGNRAIDGQLTLIEALSDGMPPADSLSRLAAILTAEDQQTQRLSALLRNRQTEPGADDVDALG